MVGHRLPKPGMRVRSPLPAPVRRPRKINTCGAFCFLHTPPHIGWRWSKRAFPRHQTSRSTAAHSGASRRVFKRRETHHFPPRTSSRLQCTHRRPALPLVQATLRPAWLRRDSLVELKLSPFFTVCSIYTTIHIRCEILWWTNLLQMEKVGKPYRIIALSGGRCGTSVANSSS